MEGSGPVGAAVTAPTVLGKLTLLGQIGEGGMARIFLARARGIGGFEKLVVVKQILPRLAEDAEFIARFFQEARLAATLDHPNIASVYDVDQEGEAYFYSMEYVRGRDLQKVMRKAQQAGRKLSLDEIVTIVGGLCAGLHHAHTRLGPDGDPLGIVHRDVSPSNVLLSFEGAIKLADFGVAKARTGMVSTDVGTLRGKLGYLSPEQCRGEALDRRSDVYAVGVLLWEMLTGQRLHLGDSEVAIIHRIAQGHAPSPREHRPDVTDDLERIVARALAREPAQRYASAHALQTDLEEHARQQRLATSARTVATLMRDLFGEDDDAHAPHAREATTAHFRGHGQPPDERRTLPTETIAPLGFTPPNVQLEPRSTPELEPEPELDRELAQRRPWAGVALGLTLGVVLGGGGLYLASRSDEPPRADPAALPTTAASERPAEPVAAAANVAAPSASSSTPSTPTPAEPEATAALTPPAVADQPAERTSSKRRKARRRRSSSSPRPIDLDSPLPPAG
jgi:serine/threonine protein kinase